MARDKTTFLLFVYGTLLPDEPDHALLAEATRLGAAATPPRYSLVEFRAMAGLIESGITAVQGELYEVSWDVLNACDKHQDHPSRYHRREIDLADGRRAHSYLLHPEQARGLRRIRHGDWRARFRR